MIKLHVHSLIINVTISLTFDIVSYYVIPLHLGFAVPQLRKTIIESATRNNISQNNFHGSHTIINVYDLFIHF